ncbi:MAG: hypothetical protein U1F21_11560 [Sphaerotilus natans]
MRFDTRSDRRRAPSAVLAQTADDAARLRQAGAPEAAIEICGNLKYDLQRHRRYGHRAELACRSGYNRWCWLRALAQARTSRCWRRRVRCWRSVRPPQPRPLLLLVPHHPQRFDRGRRGVIWRPDAGAGAATGLAPGRALWPGGRCLAGRLDARDAGLCTLRGCGAAGGQLRAAGRAEPDRGSRLRRCPVLAGPHVFNFAQPVAQALAAGTAFQVPDATAQAVQALSLADDAEAQAAARQAALGSVAADRGAAAHGRSPGGAAGPEAGRTQRLVPSRR